MSESSYPQIDAMLTALAKARPEVQPSAFWQHLNRRNLEDLKLSGFDNFKRTVALNYFTWVVTADDAQLKFLRAHVHWTQRLASFVRAKRTSRHEGFRSALNTDKNQQLTAEQSFHLTFLTYLLWAYAARQDARGQLAALDEPLSGNPPRVFLGKKLISQDLANSFLEYRSITQGIKTEQVRTILELGAGYGRTAYVFLKLMPRVRYLVADIPPALYVAQEYLCGQFPNAKAFRFRDFSDYATVAAEFEAAQIAFLLPSQLELLPHGSAELFVNISSLHEMTPPQIAYYFDVLEHRISRYFYLKEWKVSHLPDNVIVRESDYPVRAEWQRLFWRECPVQTQFFEALLELPAHSSTK